MKKLFYLFLLFASNLSAQLTIVAVGEADLEVAKFQVEQANFVGTISSQEKKMALDFIKIIKNDFGFYKKRFMTTEDASSDGFNNPSYSKLKNNNISFYTEIKISKNVALRYEVHTYDVATGRRIIAEKGALISGKIREAAHGISDYIYQSIIKKKSIFQSKILFVSDKTGSKSSPRKELYIMDFDGYNKKQLTFHGGTVISPAISRDRSRVLYSLIRDVEKKKKRNINLRMLNLKTGKDTLLSKRNGINSGAIFMPNDENKIVLTLSHIGNAELFIMDLSSRKLTRLTKHYAPDVDPSVSVDGTRLAFLSGRAGAAMIYTSLINGLEKKVKRISYVGKYNATPRFSPDGSEIAFSSWLDNRFDIFRIDADGANLSRLTKDFGSNEDPSYSNDGQFLAFSSQRVLSRTKAVQNIYIMDRNGEILGPVTKNFGNCITPRWTK